MKNIPRENHGLQTLYEGNKPGICSGNQASKWGAVAVVDNLQIPTNLKPGKYILGWRLDCESTAQVWSNCADIVLEK